MKNAWVGEALYPAQLLQRTGELHEPQVGRLDDAVYVGVETEHLIGAQVQALRWVHEDRVDVFLLLLVTTYIESRLQFDARSYVSCIVVDILDLKTPGHAEHDLTPSGTPIHDGKDTMFLKLLEFRLNGHVPRGPLQAGPGCVGVMWDGNIPCV